MVARHSLHANAALSILAVARAQSPGEDEGARCCCGSKIRYGSGKGGIEVLAAPAYTTRGGALSPRGSARPEKRRVARNASAQGRGGRRGSHARRHGGSSSARRIPSHRRPLRISASRREAAARRRDSSHQTTTTTTTTTMTPKKKCERTALSARGLADSHSR